LIKIWIPGGTPSSKNSRIWTGRFSIASKATQKWWKESKDVWEKHAKEFREEFEKKEKPVKVYFQFVRGTKHKFDFINPAQAVQDEMVKYGWIPDDNADEIIPIFEKHTYNKEKPGCWIKMK